MTHLPFSSPLQTGTNDRHFCIEFLPFFLRSNSAP
jgi:hypothetical protein